jgi:outer membrane immunogenic protein
MKYFVGPVVALGLAALSQSALAQEQPAQAPQPVLVSVHPWSGCFVGANLAYGRNHTGLTSINKVADFGNETDKNVLGGGEIGCDHQIGPWVVGIGSEFDFGDLDGSHAIPTFPTFVYRNSVPWLVTATARAGYAVTDDVLVYARGGAAWTQNNITVDFTVPRTGLSESATDSRVGWTVGAGTEYRFLGQWFAFLEYNYSDFGKKTVAFTPGSNTVGGTPDILAITQDVQTALVGAGYRF